MKIALIADEFTRIGLELEDGVEVYNLTPSNFASVLLFNKPDVLLVESAWRGYKDSWKSKIADYGSGKIDLHLLALVKLSRSLKIPTYFYNKEDPVNYERFDKNVAIFEYVLTSEERCIQRYKKQFSNLKSVEPCPLLFQPKLHNPSQVEIIDELKDKIIFCGGLYSQEFPERAQRILGFIEAVGAENMVVFGRNFADWQKALGSNSGIDLREPFEYLKSPFYYKQGRAQLNVNTVDGSRTMMSRRMIELIACGANVIDVTNNLGCSNLSSRVIQVNAGVKLEEIQDRSVNFGSTDDLIKRYSYSFLKTCLGEGTRSCSLD